jgi:hypothetical protein
MGKDAPNPLLVPDPAPLDKFAQSTNDDFSDIMKYLYNAQVSWKVTSLLELRSYRERGKRVNYL